MKKKNLVLMGSAAMLSLALAGSIGAVVTASAATEITGGKGGEAKTEVTYTVEDSWTVTIPESIVVGGAAGTVKAENVVIEQGNELKVTVESANTWKVQDEDGNGFTYQLKAGGAVITDEVFTVEAGETGGASKELTAELNDTNGGKYSTGGETYTDTLTFTVESVEKAG